jgi:Fur family ferric uptake transcriptional regulator
MDSARMPHQEQKEPVVQHLDLRHTRLRDGVITIFNANPNRAFSENEIRQELSSACDRVTLYRTIKTLLSKVFIHKIVCEDGVLKYALNESKNDSHAHFQCTRCEKVFCMRECTIPTPVLPQEFEPESYQFLVKGNCRKCVDC